MAKIVCPSIRDFQFNICNSEGWQQALVSVFFNLCCKCIFLGVSLVRTLSLHRLAHLGAGFTVLGARDRSRPGLVKCTMVGLYYGRRLPGEWERNQPTFIPVRLVPSVSPWGEDGRPRAV